MPVRHAVAITHCHRIPPIGIAALGVHTGAMLATIGLISITVYEWIGLALLRSHWINFDFVWIAALSLGGALLLLGKRGGAGPQFARKPAQRVSAVI